MLKAVLTWIIMFGVSALLARGSAWQWAFHLTMPFSQYDEKAIYGQIKSRVFTRTWLISTIVSSTIVAGAMLADEGAALLLIAFGMILIVVQTAIQGYNLFRIALSEMSLPWPPEVGS